MFMMIYIPDSDAKIIILAGKQVKVFARDAVKEKIKKEKLI